MELGGLFKEFERLFQEIKKDLGTVFSLIKTNSININSIKVELQKVKEEYSSKEEVLTLKREINTLKKDFNSFSILYEEEKENSQNALKELKKDINKIVNLELKDVLSKLTSLEEVIQSYDTTIDKIEHSQLVESTNRKTGLQGVRDIIIKLEESVNNISNVVQNIKLSKKDIIKTLQEDGNIDLLYNLKITPRILPKKGVEGLLILDARDNKLKYFIDNKWIII